MILILPGKHTQKKRREFFYGAQKIKLIFLKALGAAAKLYGNIDLRAVIPNTERRFKETDSEFIRNELAKLLSDSHCDACEGSRLKKESRNIFINGTPIQDITEQKITDALTFFQKIKLEGAKA